jgi:hypothetical protein
VQNVDLDAPNSSSALLGPSRLSAATIGGMKTTPEDQDWLRLAEFTSESHGESDARLDKLEQLRWRLRRPAR